MSNSKEFTIVEQQTFPKKEIISITIKRPLSVDCVTKLTVVDQKLFLSNFENNEFNEEILEKLISDNLIDNYGVIKGTKIIDSNEDRFIDPDSMKMKKTPQVLVWYGKKILSNKSE